MAKRDTSKDGFFNSAAKDGFFNAPKDGFFSKDDCFELDPDMLEHIAGGAGQNGVVDPDYFDTYQYWRDPDGVLRSSR